VILRKILNEAEVYVAMTEWSTLQRRVPGAGFEPASFSL